MLFAHMDQLGLVVRKIEASGFLRLERLGGVPERALAAQELLICVGEGRDIHAVVGNKSHHATSPEEKYRVVPYQEILVDAGFSSADDAWAAGVKVGSPVVYAPKAFALAGDKIAGTSVDDRAGCAVIVEVARLLAPSGQRPTIHFVFSTQEEYNLRGATAAAQALKPDIAIQLDLMLATDTPDMQARGDLALGGGPGMSLYSFHGRGTLNGTIPHPALVSLFERAAAQGGFAAAAQCAGRRADRLFVCPACPWRRRRDRPWLPLPLHPFGSGGLRSFRSCQPLRASRCRTLEH